ncbi:PREDICTED: protein LITTLE ZIPPER 1 [Theobroma cacao]|uniref:Protein LITTLE ZIPPER 1 n=1 Tax=Theobroma cacao TaxID=3641 RepID=A0AB32VGG9_THECC|nr:PREDICTED: protein LITTLE ZIPPER 1 [Theobroma cacao]
MSPPAIITAEEESLALFSLSLISIATSPPHDASVIKQHKPTLFIGAYIPSFLSISPHHFQYNLTFPSSLSSPSIERNHRRMCNNMDWSPTISASSKRRHRSKQSKVQIYRLSRKRCEENVEKDMELLNLKLYLENQSIIEENEKLRKKANLLHQENLALMSDFQKKFPHLDRFSTTLLLLLRNH